MIKIVTDKAPTVDVASILTAQEIEGFMSIFIIILKLEQRH